MSPRPIRAAAVVAVFLCAATSAWGAERLTVEGLYGKPSIYAEIPTKIQWAGESGTFVSYLEKRGEGDEKQTAFIVRPVDSDTEQILIIADTVSVPGDLAEGDDDTFAIGSYQWDDGDRVVFTFRGDVFTLDRDGDSWRVIRRTTTQDAEKDPVFSPGDGRRVAYTRAHDLYVLDLDSNEEIRLTTTGSDSLLNGILDWVYMEELFTRGDVRAFWWSPDGSRIAFLEFREHPVPEFPLVDWIPINGKWELQHYPKPGDSNPIVRVGMVEVESGEIVWADTDTSDDSYIARVYWLGDSRGIAMEKLNRTQDKVEVLFADAATGAVDAVLEETADTWIDVTYMHHYYENSRRFLRGSERDGHCHLYLYNLDGTLIRQVTSGDWEVISLEGVDEESGRIYFVANREGPLERHLYAVDEDGGNLERITEEEGTHDVILAPDFRHYVDTWDSHERPARVSVHAIDGKRRFVIGDRKGERFDALDLPAPEFFTIAHGGREYQCMMFKPPRIEKGRKYPVIVYTYGGPGAQIVRKHWSRHFPWHAMMAERGFVVFTLDNRGCYGFGQEWEGYLLREMGRVEMEDQIAGVEYLKTLPYVNPDRIGIWGWSYGGYMTLMGLFKHGDVFNAGVSVAPVADWRLYDTIYTERYLKLPEDNESGYRESSPVHFVDDFDGHLLVMHGMADDNVHFQNTVRLTKALIGAGRDFDLMMFPQKKHGISGTADRVFLYNKMTRFFERHLQGGALTP